ncbi:alcohol dehydrogenase [Picosynechococcus sp. PCC 7003]|uniref:zinc-dependent alcohol dehydrogenase family protein n=1 Tax=Picosynechococcus sp. PCC 7003 TaxID=374981 RepID=UPI00081059A1|nr:zinc-dependent alcohol dehydrogenase family protein [Picosynechococcus sp. PCC 7003]ANV84876.1 alcohol dehydrogenase [Picosynechococcus sp. PCC 7003]
MKAIAMTAAGNPDVLQLIEAPQPQITTPQQVLVKLQAAGVNPIDTKVRSRGTFYDDPLPAILGCDGAGIIEAVGSDVKKFAVGDAVYFCDGGLGKAGTGNYAEYAVVDARFIAKKPENLSFAAAAAAPLILITAWEALGDRARLQSGQTVLIHGGAGGVGHVAIQLAKLWGATVFTTVSTPDKARLARQYGADEVILYRDVDVTETVHKLTDEAGVDVAFDTIGGQVFWETVPAVKTYGDLVTILEPDFQLGTLKQARLKNLRISLELMLTPMLTGDVAGQMHQANILRQCAQWFEQGKLHLHLGQTFPLAEAAKAHVLIEQGSTTGKIALTL